MTQFNLQTHQSALLYKLCTDNNIGAREADDLIPDVLSEQFDTVDDNNFFEAYEYLREYLEVAPTSR